MTMIERVAKALPGFVRDVIGCLGAGMISAGAWELHPAAGLIVGGCFLVGGAWLHARLDR